MELVEPEVAIPIGKRVNDSAVGNGGRPCIDWIYARYDGTGDVQGRSTIQVVLRISDDIAK